MMTTKRPESPATTGIPTSNQADYRGNFGLNPIVVGWINYYGRYYRVGIDPLLQRVSSYLRRWAAKKYKRLRGAKRFDRWWMGLLVRQPDLFVHWRLVRNY
jgi:RNA-directed DNA polymerase